MSDHTHVLSLDCCTDGGAPLTALWRRDTRHVPRPHQSDTEPFQLCAALRLGHTTVAPHVLSVTLEGDAHEAHLRHRGWSACSGPQQVFPTQDVGQPADQSPFTDPKVDVGFRHQEVDWHAVQETQSPSG
jgi:hypothetical protein